MEYSLVKGKHNGTIVFIHGNSSSSYVFKDIMASKKISRSMMAIDLPGHGKSMDGYYNEADFSMASYCEKIATVLNKIDDDIIIAGNSLGGHIAIEVSERIPRLKGLVIFGAPPLKKPFNFDEALIPWADLQIYVSEFATDSEIETAANIIVFDKKTIDGIVKAYKETYPKVRTTLAKDFTQNRWANQFEIFTNLQTPKFIIAGFNDACVNIEYLKEVTNKCQGTCELITFKDCGHYPSLEKSEEFITTMKYISNKVFI